MIRWIALLGLLAFPVSAEPLRVAVASNFMRTAEQIAAAYAEQTGEEVELITGASGALFLQILHGAPFDVFLSADAERPARLVREGIAPGTMIYAIGRLALISAQPGDVSEQTLDAPFERLAIANPEIAPYGAAALETLHALSIETEGRIAIGNSVGQAYAFVASGNADLGLVALSQAIAEGRPHWEVPQDLHPPVLQAAARLNDRPAAGAFMDFLASPEVLALIVQSGYGYPP